MTITPQPGKQSEFVHSEADIVFYGGHAGSGKTFGLVLIPLMFYDDPTFNGVIFRRTYPEITNPGGLWDEMTKIYPILGARGANHTWTFPSGMSIQAGHLQHEKDKFKFQGAQVVYFAFDELPHFTKTQFFYVLSRNRKSDSNTIPFIRATMNADADSWVAKFIDWYIGEDGFAREDRSGVIRWFIVKNDVEIWADSKEELKRQFPEESPLSFTFINATLDDNEIFLKTEGEAYRAKLSSLDEVQKQRLMHGNWRIKAHGNRLFSLPNYAEWQDVGAMAWLDSAYGGGNHTSLAIAARVKDRIQVRGFTWDRHVMDVYSEIVRACDRFNVGTLVVESNGDKGAAARDLYKLRKGHVRGYMEKMNKHIRIVQFVYKNWALMDFANDCEPDFLTCVLNYAEGMEPDDEADALAGVIRLLTSQGSGSKYRSRTA